MVQFGERVFKAVRPLCVYWHITIGQSARNVSSPNESRWFQLLCLRSVVVSCSTGGHMFTGVFMHYWRMQLHPDGAKSSAFYSQQSLAAGLIGLDFATEVGDLLVS